MSTEERGDVFDRARADLRTGRTTTARTRLKSYLAHVPRSIPARALLAHAYRLDGHLDEAGRWGYLSPTACTPAERAAYEHSCRHRWGRHWTATSTLRGLHWPTGAAGGDPHADAVLADLDVRAAAELHSWSYVPLHRRLLARVRRQQPAPPPAPPPRTSGPLPDMHHALTQDEHLARLVTGLRAHRDGLTTAATTPEELHTAVRQAAVALDHAHPQWKDLLERLAIDLDADLHPRDPTATHDAQGIAIDVMNQLDRAATGRGSPGDRRGQP
ncbi:DUF6584 family protein [uncultured Pseudokineococcus sp.]|uniref:DUF6584 family protein n=1 Tax=uncultured Pseudokineococcus sp. TaxID=1642928 RepID=UPI0026056901|nr:DUF6584 family protein [uncultured Pseudokineococcus sp.]